MKVVIASNHTKWQQISTNFHIRLLDGFSRIIRLSGELGVEKLRRTIIVLLENCTEEITKTIDMHIRIRAGLPAMLQMDWGIVSAALMELWECIPRFMREE